MAAIDQYLTVPPRAARPDYRTAELTERDPQWLAAAEARLAEILSLPADWNEAGAGPVRRHTALYALTVLNRFCMATTKSPQLVPTQNGGVQIEWHSGGVDVEILVERPNQAELYVEYLETGESVERPLRWNDPALRAALEQASS